MIRGAHLLLRTPCRVEIILHARSVQGRRPRLPIDENHVVAFAVPVPFPRIAQVVDIEVAADVMALTDRVQNDIVAAAGRILAAEFVVGVIHPVVRYPVGRIFPVPLGMESQLLLRQLIVGFVIHIEIKFDWMLRLALNRNAGSIRIRHTEEAVECLSVLGTHHQCR